MNAVELSLFAHRLAAICDEMGAVLRRSALSPNIKDREDYSCALFDAAGELVAQAAHIPVHLGSMAFAMRGVVERIDWQPGDVVVFNDPFLGGTHLPDITVVTPIFIREHLGGFAATRAHHADVGGVSPGSMGIHAALTDEGVVLSPGHWFRSGREQQSFLRVFLQRARNPEERMGDLAAQRAACNVGVSRLTALSAVMDIPRALEQLLTISEAYGKSAIADIPDGCYHFEDVLEDDGLNHGPFTLCASVTVTGETATVDFSGTASQCPGPVNCPMSVTAAAVFYAFRCLMPEGTPQTSAIFRPIRMTAPEGCLVHAKSGAAVAAGNVETSQRIVDVVLGALAQACPERIPAAAQGTMNNVIFGGRNNHGKAWVYYETLAGGMGAHAHGDGLSAVQCHMTNTKNTSIEVLEMHYPLRIRTYAIRRGSGGSGVFCGGDGVIREWEILAPCKMSLLTERRETRPYGLFGGEPGQAGSNALYSNSQWKQLPAKCTHTLKPGNRLRIETPGGGGYGTEK
ncbi:MAG: hydantoinase B/oxoprolinase family protein [Mariprofundaceae bacterium]|nr:hydantoinase B/oxoprolinase family protein [Mariprofundaceae bacterium]